MKKKKPVLTNCGLTLCKCMLKIFWICRNLPRDSTHHKRIYIIHIHIYTNMPKRSCKCKCDIKIKKPKYAKQFILFSIHIADNILHDYYIQINGNEEAIEQLIKDMVDYYHLFSFGEEYEIVNENAAADKEKWINTDKLEGRFKYLDVRDEAMKKGDPETWLMDFLTPETLQSLFV
jgi:hypothetical protein